MDVDIDIDIVMMGASSVIPLPRPLHLYIRCRNRYECTYSYRNRYHRSVFSPLPASPPSPHFLSDSHSVGRVELRMLFIASAV